MLLYSLKNVIVLLLIPCTFICSVEVISAWSIWRQWIRRCSVKTPRLPRRQSITILQTLTAHLPIYGGEWSHGLLKTRLNRFVQFIQKSVCIFDTDYQISFLKEIDAITTQPTQTSESGTEPSAPAPTPPRPEPKPDQQTHDQNGPAQEFQYNTQYSLAGGELSSRLVLFCVYSIILKLNEIMWKLILVVLCCSWVRDGWLAGSVGWKYWLLLLLEYSDQWGGVGAPALPGKPDAGPTSHGQVSCEYEINKGTFCWQSVLNDFTSWKLSLYKILQKILWYLFNKNIFYRNIM